MITMNELTVAGASHMGVIAMIYIIEVIAIFIYSVSGYINKKTIITSTIFLIIGILNFVAVSDAIYEKDKLFIADIIGRMPYEFVLLILVFWGTVEAVFYVHMKKKSHSVITGKSVKESMDAMSDGICFSTKAGTPILINKKMYQICSELFNETLMNANMFWDKLEYYRDNKVNRERASKDVLVLETGDGKAWHFYRQTLNIKNESFYGIIAYDITRQFELNRALDDKNKKMKEINERLKKFNNEIEKITEEREILAAKVKVHDDIGRVLLMFRRYLEQPENQGEKNKMLMFLRTITDIMNHEAGKGDNDWNVFLKNAAQLKVDVIVEGEIPKDINTRRNILAVCRECLTNTVKHAGGNVMNVLINEDCEKVVLQVTNNGKSPKEDIVETGGLKNLRRTIQGEGGKLIISSTPRFRLTAELSKK